jgi:predicted dehydrogenase
VPTDKHTEVAMPLLEQGCDLLIEKPICTSVEDAELIVKKAREKNLVVQVGHIEHFNPVMEFMEERVNNPRFITADRLAPFNPRGTEVGVVLDLMIHDIGVILKLANSPVVKIEAVGVNVLSKSEDIANARIQFENKCVANLNVSRVSLKKLREIRIFQQGTYMSLDYMNQKGHVIRIKDMTEIIPEEVPIEKHEPLKSELASFADCVVNKKNPKVDAKLGQTALEVALEITRQIREQMIAEGSIK